MPGRTRHRRPEEEPETPEPTFTGSRRPQPLTPPRVTPHAQELDNHAQGGENLKC